jgi:Flp pilus assembly protein TadD
MWLASEGQNQLNQGQYAAAESQFQEAANHAATSDITHLMQTYVDFTRNKWAENYFNLGVNAAKNDDFTSAKEYFNNAYNKCTSGYANQASFAANRDAMQLAIEGQNHLNQGQYEAAERKFREAQNKATDYDIKNRMQTFADSGNTTGHKLAQNNLAENDYTQGVNAARNGDFVSAKYHFNDAYQKSTSDYSNRAAFAANRDAMQLVIESLQLYSLDKSEEGQQKLQSALSKIVDTKGEFIALVIPRMLEIQINGFWSGFFEAEKAGDESGANKFLSYVEIGLQNSAIKLLGSEYQKFKQMYDLHKKGYQLYDEAISLQNDNLENLDMLNKAMDGLQKSEAVFEEAVKIDQRFKHELGVVQKSRSDLSDLIRDIKRELELEQNEENQELLEQDEFKTTNSVQI